MRNSESPLFQFNTSPVRTVMIDGEPWFVGKDLCNVLEIANPRNAFARLPDIMKGVHTVDTLGGTQSVSGSEKGTTNVSTLGTRSEKGLSSTETLGTTQSIQRLGDLEKGRYSMPTLGGEQSMTIVSKSGTEDTT